MSKKLFALLLLVLVISTKPALAERVAEAQPEQIEASKLDARAEILALYLAKKNSPLEHHAQDFIDAAKTYDLDWKLVAAISGVESFFGKFIPGGYNAWGWGVYGTQAIYFSSWKEGIFTVSKGLKENYINRGLTDPYLMNRIYASSPAWGAKVTYFIQDLEKFASGFDSSKDLSKIQPAPTNIAAVSASPVLR